MKENDLDKLRMLLGTGIGNARKKTELAGTMELREWELRGAVRELIKQGLPVASSSDCNRGGYFIASTHEEVDITISELKSRIAHLQERITEFQVAARAINRPGQLPLRLGVKIKKLCAWCRKDIDTGEQLTDEEYNALEKVATHGICPACLTKYYPEVDKRLH